MLALRSCHKSSNLKTTASMLSRCVHRYAVSVVTSLRECAGFFCLLYVSDVSQCEHWTDFVENPQSMEFERLEASLSQHSWINPHQMQGRGILALFLASKSFII